MGDSVERALEETVSTLQAAKRARLLNSREIDEVVRKRRNHEYALKKQKATRTEYLQYASFERELALLLQKRADKKKIKKKTVQLIVGKTSSRVNLVYSRAVKAFRGDVDLWLHYARHCVQTGTTRTAQKVLARAIAYRGDSERVWLAAVALHFDTCGDAKGARNLAQRALRAMPDSVVMWKEYFRVEVCYLAKLIIRRLAIGLPPVSEPSRGKERPPQSRNAIEGPDATINSPEATAHLGDIENTAVGQDDEASLSEDERDDEDSDSSESETSEAESAAEMKTKELGLSSFEKSGDGEPDRDPTENLSFWEGGVPMAVFKRACESANVTAEGLFEFWDIAVSSPHVSPRLIAAMSKHICKRYPKRPIARLIAARSTWDCANSEYRRTRDENSNEDSNHTDAPSDRFNDYNRRVIDEAAKLPDRFGEVVDGEQVSKWSDSERNAALECVRDVAAALKRTASFRQMADELKSVLNLLGHDNKDGREATSKESETTDGGTGMKGKNWSLATLEHAIAQGKNEIGNWKSGDVLTAVKEKAGVPFRGVHHDKVVGQYLAAETDIKAVREVTDVLLATPPLTMQGLRSMIEAEMRILETSAASFQSEISNETRMRLRKLFAKSEGVSGARHDVEFWLLYLDFERRKTKDAKAASAVHAKALRILSKENVALFIELHTLRNLT